MKRCEQCGLTDLLDDDDVRDWLVLIDYSGTWPKGCTVTLCDDCATTRTLVQLAPADDHELHMTERVYVPGCAACQQEATAVDWLAAVRRFGLTAANAMFESAQ